MRHISELLLVIGILLLLAAGFGAKSKVALGWIGCALAFAAFLFR